MGWNFISGTYIDNGTNRSDSTKIELWISAETLSVPINRGEAARREADSGAAAVIDTIDAEGGLAFVARSMEEVQNALNQYI